MFHIDSDECTQCGSCVNVCPQKAISIHNGMTAINQELCVQCGLCVEVCPVGAIRDIVPAHAKLEKGGEKMPYGYGRGFGFRGASPSAPYVGRGRGGLPRCWSPGLWGVTNPYIEPLATPYWGVPAGADELGFLKNQADIMKSQLEEIERRIKELEKKD